MKLELKPVPNDEAETEVLVMVVVVDVTVVGRKKEAPCCSWH